MKLWSNFLVSTLPAFYPTPQLPLLSGLCEKCWCCSECVKLCEGKCYETNNKEAFMRVISCEGEQVDRASEFATKCAEEERKMFGEVSEDEEEHAEGVDEDDESADEE